MIDGAGFQMTKNLNMFSSIKSPKFVRHESYNKPQSVKTILEAIPSPASSPSSGRGSQMSSHSHGSHGGGLTAATSARRPTVGGSPVTPSRFLSQEKIHDAASFLTQKLSGVTSSPPTSARNRNLSAGSIPSSTTSSTTSPHLGSGPKFIRGPFGYTDL